MERRSTFRFRLPWSQSASEPESANKPSTQPSTRTGPNRTSTRQATRTRTTSQPSGRTATKTSPSSSPATDITTRKKPPSAPPTATPEKPPSPAQPSATTTTPLPRSPQPQTQNSSETKATPTQPSAETKAPIQSTTNTSPLPESSPVLPESSSEIKAPIQSSTTNAPASPKSETQTPTTTISTTPTSTISQRPQSSTKSQPLTPSQEQQTITSQPASPSYVSTKSNASQPPSPSRPASQSREMSPKSSPTGNTPQVLSTDQLTPKAASPVNQTSSNLPFGMTSQEQPKDQITDQPTSPRKQSQDSPETYSKSTETLPSISEKAPTTTSVLPQSDQIKKEAISDISTEAKDRSPSKISDSSRIISEPKMARLSETNIETKVKEVVQETNDTNYAAAENIGVPLTSKEQPDIVFKSKQANPDNDQIRVMNRVSNGKQQRNKLVSNDTRKETEVSSAPQNTPLNKEVIDNVSKFIHRMTVGNDKQNIEEGPVSVITLAGDNRGAYMQLGTDSSRKGRAIQIHRGYKLNADESTTDTEGRQPNQDERTTKDEEIEAYMNCNVQGLNNSITFDSLIEGKNPGIHMSFPRKNREIIRSNEETGQFEAHKAEFNVTRAQKHTYEEPTIRRRCYRGLFSEPSDSDSDNPEKHGCHVGCMKKIRDNDIDIL